MTRRGFCYLRPESWPWARFTFSIVQLGLTVTILLLVRYNLSSMTAVQQHGKMMYTSTCYLAPQDSWPSTCIYAEVVACISMLLTFVMSVLQCCATSKVSCRKQCPRYLQMSQTLLMLFGLVWWTVAASILQYYGNSAAAADLPQATPRTIVIACCWGSMGLFALMLAGDLLTLKPQQQTCALTSPVSVQMVAPMRSYPIPYPAAPPPAAAGAVPVHRAATVPASPSDHTAVQQRHLDQQQQQLLQRAHALAAGVVVGIPVAPPGAVPSGLPAAVQQPAFAGLGPGAYQLAMLGVGPGYRPGMQIVPLQPQLPPGWAITAGNASAPGRVHVVNRGT